MRINAEILRQKGFINVNAAAVYHTLGKLKQMGLSFSQRTPFSDKELGINILSLNIFHVDSQPFPLICFIVLPRLDIVPMGPL